MALYNKKNNKNATTVLEDNYIYISHLDEKFQF
jgi:hypothetical protein